jgi:hypothetical protein
MTLRSRRASAAAVCVLLAVIHTWPLALAPGRYSRNDNGDAQLNEWILAWIAHQLPRDPTHLFEANIFYPAHDALAFSEPLIVPALIGAPLAWLGGSPVLVHNLVLIAGLALTALSGCLLIEAWTGDLIAGLLTGSMLAFNTHTLTRIAHVQAGQLYALPLALFATDRLLRGGRARDAAILAAAMAMLAYTSGYLFVFGALMVAIALVVSVPVWRRSAGRTIGYFAIATVLASIAILPLALPYQRVARDQHMVRTLDLVKDYSATPRGYLAAAGRLHFAAWSHGFFRDPVDSFFPGVIVLGCAIGAIVFGLRRPEWRTRVLGLAAMAVAGFVLSLGTATPVYGWLFAVFPPMQGLRAAARFGNLFLLGVAVLGGLGLSWWRHEGPGPLDAARQTPGPGPSPRRRHRYLVAIALVALANLESLRAPFEYRDFTGIAGIYKLLAQEPGRVVLAEQPFFPRWAIFENAPYVLASTAHWRPLMNGYSGYTPDTYQRYADSFWYFPEERSIQAMKDAGVTHVMVHPARFERDADKVVAQISARTDLELVAVGPNGMRLYRLRR